MKLYQIKAPHFTAGLEINEGVVMKAADIIKYMKRWSEDRVANYCEVKGWTMEEVKDGNG